MRLLQSQGLHLLDLRGVVTNDPGQRCPPDCVKLVWKKLSLLLNILMPFVNIIFGLTIKVYHLQIGFSCLCLAKALNRTVLGQLLISRKQTLIRFSSGIKKKSNSKGHRAW